jgi:protease-4
MESMFRPMSVAERALMKSKLHYYYGRFIQTVAEGRDMKTEEVDKVGRGRVWTGEQSKPINLIDEFGGIADAVQYAKSKAGMTEQDKARLVLLPKEDSNLLSQLLGGGIPGLWENAQAKREEQAAARIVRSLMPGIEELLEAIPGSVWAEPHVPQARLPFSIVWE